MEIANVHGLKACISWSKRVVYIRSLLCWLLNVLCRCPLVEVTPCQILWVFYTYILKLLNTFYIAISTSQPLSGLRYRTYAGDTISWQLACYSGYIYYIQDMSLVLVHSCGATKLSSQIFVSQYFSNFPHICKALILYSLRIDDTNMRYYDSSSYRCTVIAVTLFIQQ